MKELLSTKDLLDYFKQSQYSITNQNDIVQMLNNISVSSEAGFDVTAQIYNDKDELLIEAHFFEDLDVVVLKQQICALANSQLQVFIDGIFLTGILLKAQVLEIHQLMNVTRWLANYPKMQTLTYMFCSIFVTCYC